MSQSTPAARLMLALAVVLSGAGAFADGTGTPAYLAAYRASHAALQSGDKTTATQQARAAWEAAEQELGDHGLTAILAYNFGRLVIFDDAANARAAMERVRALLDAGIADLPARDVHVYASYSDFLAEGPTRREADRLRKYLQAFPLDAAEVNPDLAPMWLRLATHDVAEKRFRHALESAEAAEMAILRTAPESKVALAEAITIGGMAHLVPFPRKAVDIQAAHNDFSRAYRLFPPQEDIDSFDPMLARIMAWNMAARSALITLGREDYPDHEDADEAKEQAAPWHVFTYDIDPDIDCSDLEWEYCELPDYPQRALREAHIGAVLVGFRIGEDRALHDLRVLAEVPEQTFGEVVLDAMKRWRVKKPSASAECNRNRVRAIRFVLD